MKINFYVLLYITICASTISANPKITQMLYVEKNNTHDQKSDLLYCITDDNNLYFAEKDDIELSSEKPCQILEKSEKDKKYRPYTKRIVLIGQPMIIDRTWTMPAVIKKKGILENILRPDLYIIEYKAINADDITSSPEPLFNDKDDFGSEDEDEPTMLSKFVITKIGRGHRTKVTKIGIIKDSNDHPLLMSGSEWPTVNIYNIAEKTLVNNYQDTYLLDVINQTDKNYTVMGSNIKKSWFADKKFTIPSILLLDNDTENTFDLDQEMVLGYLCKVFFDPRINYSKKENSFENILKKYNTFKKEIADKLTDDTCYFSDNQQFILAPREKSYYVPSPQNRKPIKKEIQDILNEKSISITASTFDFINHTLFYATYNKTAKMHRISKIKIDQEEELIPLKWTKKPVDEKYQNYDSSSDEEIN